MKVAKALRYIAAAGFTLVAGQNCGLPYHADPGFGISAFASAEAAGLKCVDPSSENATPLKKLNKVQFVNTITDLFGTSVVQTVQLDIDQIADDMKFESADSYVKELYESTVQEYSTIADKLGAAVSSQADLQAQFGSSCLADANPTSDCFKTLITNAGTKIWRRPLTADEVSAVQNLLTYATSKEEQISSTISYLLQSPNFVYLIENGLSGDGSKGSPLQLSDYEIASRISYLVLDTLPDDTLLKLASQGQLRNYDTQVAQVNRLFALPRAREKVGRFIKYWLVLNGTSHSMRDFPTSPTEFVDGIDGPSLKTEVIREIQEYAQYIIFDQNGTYADLMSSNASFARTDALASIYGHSKVVSNLPSAMPQRHGLLSRPVFLANSIAETSTIIRGVRMRARILCVDAVAPGVDITSQGPDVTTEDMIRKYSTRERYDLKVGQTACMGCHASINPFGNAFENFDSFGRLRALEIDYRADSSRIAVHPIDTAVQVTIGNSLVSVSDSDDMQRRIASSPEGQACLTKQSFRFYQLQNETTDDACSLAATYTAIANPKGSILNGFKQLVLSNLTTKRVN